MIFKSVKFITSNFFFQFYIYMPPCQAYIIFFLKKINNIAVCGTILVYKNYNPTQTANRDLLEIITQTANQPKPQKNDLGCGLVRSKSHSEQPQVEYLFLNKVLFVLFKLDRSLNNYVTKLLTNHVTGANTKQIMFSVQSFYTSNTT